MNCLRSPRLCLCQQWQIDAVKSINIDTFTRLILLTLWSSSSTVNVFASSAWRTIAVLAAIPLSMCTATISRTLNRPTKVHCVVDKKSSVCVNQSLELIKLTYNFTEVSSSLSYTLTRRPPPERIETIRPCNPVHSSEFERRTLSPTFSTGLWSSTNILSFSGFWAELDLTTSLVQTWNFSFWTGLKC